MYNIHIHNIHVHNIYMYIYRHVYVHINVHVCITCLYMLCGLTVYSNVSNHKQKCVFVCG